MIVKRDIKLLSYLAGFFDGEGCISIANNRIGIVPTITISVGQKDPTVLFKYKELFGGSVRIHRCMGFRGQFGYIWCIDSGVKALKCLTWLFPYLLIKKSQADLAIQMLQRQKIGKVNGGKRMTEEDKKFRVEGAKKLSQLKVVDGEKIFNKLSQSQVVVGGNNRV